MDIIVAGLTLSQGSSLAGTLALARANSWGLVLVL
jgi:hypothetical protein